MAYVTVVRQLREMISTQSNQGSLLGLVDTYKNIKAKPQIFKSRAGRRNLPSVNASATASPRSLLTRRMTNAHSASLRNFHDLCAFSGKSTRKTAPIIAIMHEIYYRYELGT